MSPRFLLWTSVCLLGGCRSLDLPDISDSLSPGADMAGTSDLAAVNDLAMTPDLLSGADVAWPVDLVSIPDLVTPPDQSIPGDLAMTRDLTLPPDIAVAPDLATTPDQASVPDLRGVDLAKLPDLVNAGDLVAQPGLQFAAQQHLQAGDGTGTIVSGDFDGDGKWDLVVCSRGAPKPITLLGRGDGTFVRVVDSGPTCHDRLTAALVDGDNKWDLVMGAANGAEVLVARGGGLFQSAASLRTVESNSAGVHTVGDYNKDGKPDVITIKDHRGQASSLQLFAGNGDGTFKAGASADKPDLFGQWPSSQVLDCGNDRGIDLFCSGWGLMGYRKYTFTAVGDGTFATPGADAGGSTMSPFRPIDLELDGKPENVGWVNRNGFELKPYNTSTSFVQAGDFDGDKRIDAVIADALHGVLFFTSSMPMWTELPGYQGQPVAVAVADFDGNGKVDCATIDNMGVDILLRK